MGSKVRTDDGRIGYVLTWKHDNASGVTAVKVQFLDNSTEWLADSELTEMTPILVF